MKEGLCPGGFSVQGSLCPGGLCLGGSLLRASLSGGFGVSVQGGLCLGGSLSRWSLSGDGSLCRGASVQGVSVWGISVQRDVSPGGLCQGDLPQRPPYGNERAVGILLECILVNKWIFTFHTHSLAFR